MACIVFVAPKGVAIAFKIGLNSKFRITEKMTYRTEN